MPWTACSIKFGRYIKIKLVLQKIRGLLSKKDTLETLFTIENFIITLSETHIASVNSKLFQIQMFIRIAGESVGVAMYLSDDLKWKQRKDLETECIWLIFGCIYRTPDSASYLRKDCKEILRKC